MMSVPANTLTSVAIPTNMRVERIDSKVAARVVIDNHYLHRRPPISHAFALYWNGQIVGVCTYGTPASRHLQMGACPSEPSNVIELNRLWVHDKMPKNTESWFVSRTLHELPAKIVVSYADTREQHYGYIYRALNFHYAGWTDMDRKTPRYDYIPHDPTHHTREAFRGGYSHRVRRKPKVKYWTVTGNRSERRMMTKLSGWPVMDWKITPPPAFLEELEQSA